MLKVRRQLGLIELERTGFLASNKKLEGCDQQQVQEDPKIETSKNITSKQEREIIRARYNDNIKELNERIRTWKPFKDEQSPSWKETSVNTINDETKKKAVDDDAEKILTPTQHDSKIGVANHLYQPQLYQPLRCIGQVALGQEKSYANCLLDIGSTGTFITHKCAKRFNMKKIKDITMIVRSMGAPTHMKTVIYA